MQEPAFSQGVLPERAVIKIAGPDAADFLHNLVTADIARLQPGDAAYAALLSPQGKMLFEFFVLNDGTGFFIDCAASQKAELVKRLGFYKLRARIALIDMGDMEVAVSPDEPKQALRYLDPRSAQMGWRMIAGESNLPPAQGYDAARIALGLADSDADLGTGNFFPHEANLDQLGGVSFAKGCYVGQEVVSRMEHRGTARSRILPVRFDGDSPVKGTEIMAGGKVIGTLLSAAGNDALALLRLDRLAEAKEPLMLAGMPVVVRKPGWVRYDVKT